METLNQTNCTFARTNQSSTSTTTLLASHSIFFEKYRFVAMSVAMIVQSCLGSIACMYLFQSNVNEFLLPVCASVTMASNAVFIAQGNAKLCVVTFYLSVLINSGFILMFA